MFSLSCVTFDIVTTRSHREYEKLLKACEDSKEKFSEMESQDAKCQEDIKLNKSKQKKLEKLLESEISKVSVVLIFIKIGSLESLLLVLTAKYEQFLFVKTL